MFEMPTWRHRDPQLQLGKIMGHFPGLELLVPFLKVAGFWSVRPENREFDSQNLLDRICETLTKSRFLKNSWDMLGDISGFKSQWHLVLPEHWPLGRNWSPICGLWLVAKTARVLMTSGDPCFRPSWFELQVQTKPNQIKCEREGNPDPRWRSVSVPIPVFSLQLFEKNGSFQAAILDVCKFSSVAKLRHWWTFDIWFSIVYLFYAN